MSCMTVVPDSNGNHVKLARFVLLAVSEEAKTWLPFCFRSMYNKTIIRFGFCDIQNNQGLGKGYQPQPSASADNPTSTLIILDIKKTSSNNCLVSALDSWSRGPGLSPGRGYCVVFLVKALYSHSASLHPRWVKMDQYLIQVGVQILLVASCKIKRRPDGRLGSNTNILTLSAQI